MGTAAVDPVQKMCLLQSQVEEGVFKVPDQDVPECPALVGQEPLPKRQRTAVPGDPQQEQGPDGNTRVERPLLTPRLTHHLQQETPEETV